MLSLPGFLSQSTPSLTISETDSLYLAVTTLHHQLKSYAPDQCTLFDSNIMGEGPYGRPPGYAHTSTATTSLTTTLAANGNEQVNVAVGKFANFPLEDSKITRHHKAENLQLEEEGAKDDQRGREGEGKEMRGGGYRLGALGERVKEFSRMPCENEVKSASENNTTSDTKRNIQSDDYPHSQALVTSHSAAVKAREAFHERDASFSSSIQSNDSVFTDSDLSGSIQSGDRLIPSQRLLQASPAIGSGHHSCVNGTDMENSMQPETEPYMIPTGQKFSRVKVEGVIKFGDKRSPKDSGYGSRSNTDDILSPPASASTKYSLASSSSPLTRYTVPGGNQQFPDYGGNELPILPLANSPVLVNRSYYQFYHIDDPLLSSTTHSEMPTLNVSTVKGKTPTPSRGNYPIQPIVPPEQSQSTQKKVIMDSLKPIKSASCSSLDRFSLTSSLEEFAENLDKVDVAADDSVDGDEARFGRKRLLSLTRFETLTTNLEVPQCATVVKVVPPIVSSETKQRNSLLRRLHIGKWRVKTAKSPAQESNSSKDVMITAAGQAKLRRKKGNRGRQRMVVSDDMTHKVHFPSGDQHYKQTPTPGVSHTINSSMKMKEQDHKEQKSSNVGEKRLAFSTEEDQTETIARFSQENFISSIPAQLSQSMDGLADLKLLSMQLQKLAQPSQSTTNLDLSQRASDTLSNVGLRVSHSVDDISDAVAAPLSQLAIDTDGLPREGFLWRVLGRASQRWPAFIYIVPIQNSQVGIRGFCVKKGQQVRALYRVSSQVIVETDTNHLACIPYECCRISRKLYGPRSGLVQLSYLQLYAPAPDIQPLHGSQFHLSSATTSPPTARVHTPIEMVAIQDSYDFVPLGEINVDAGDKLRVLYCDEQYVYAVKENGEAGLIPRSFCRLTRKSEKMYQKWVEHTQLPFQADYPVKFSEKPPSFIIKLSEQGVGRSSALTRVPVLEKNKTVPANLTAKVEPQNGESTKKEKSARCTLSLPLRELQKSHKPLSPTSQGRKKGAPVSPLTQSRLKSPQSPPRQQSGLSNTISVPSLSSRNLQTEQPSLSDTTAQTHSCTPTQTQKGNESIHNAQTGSRNPPTTSIQHPNPMSYAGKLMTVIKSYSPQVGTAANTARRGLRVRVVQASPDGKTLRVATKTGTQFDIPASHMCMSRKNSEPSTNFDNDVTIFANAAEFTTTSSTSSHNPKGKSQITTTNLPVECGRIMTVIHNFVPSPDNPMCTIRRGLRVKVLGGQGDQVRVITKTGTTFCIPRSHLRLSHKTSDASSFAADTYSGIKSPPNSPSMPVNREIIAEPVYRDQRTENSRVAYATAQHSPTRVSPQQRGYPSTLNSSNAKQTQSPRNGHANGSSGFRAASQSSLRGGRIGSTGSQVFELC